MTEKQFYSLCEVVTLHAFEEAMDGDEYISLWNREYDGPLWKDISPGRRERIDVKEPEDRKKQFKTSFQAVMAAGEAGTIRGTGRWRGAWASVDIYPNTFSRDWAASNAIGNCLQQEISLDTIFGKDAFTRHPGALDEWTHVKFHADGVSKWIAKERAAAGLIPPETALKKMSDGNVKPKTQEEYITWWKEAQEIRAKKSFDTTVLAKLVASKVGYEKADTIKRRLNEYFPGWSG